MESLGNWRFLIQKVLVSVFIPKWLRSLGTPPQPCAYLKGVEGPLTQVVGVEQLQLVEQLNEEVGPGLVLGDERCHLRVDGLPQGLEQREVAARI